MRRQSNAAASTSERSPFYGPDAPDTSDGAAKEGAAEQQHGFKTLPHEMNPRGTPRSTLDSIPSLIPSDINLPEQVFGEQVSFGSPYGSPEVLDFPTYCACRFLDTAPNNPENGEIFEALKTMSAYFLRADAHSICQCIQAFGLNDILFSIVRLERLFARTRDTSPVRGELTNTGRALRNALAECQDCGASGDESLSAPAASKEVCAVKEVVGSLMHEIECILHEYLSFNWDRLEEIYDANAMYLSDGGLKCLWNSSPNLQSTHGSSNSLGASPSASSSGALFSSRTQSEADEGSVHSPTSTNGSLPAGVEMETFEEYLAAKRTQSNGNGVLHGAKGESVQKAAEAVRNARSHVRAVKNWRRAKYAVTKKITEDMLGMQRKFQTLYEIFSELNRSGSGRSEAPERGPVLLLLGGGMAAGKSTVREIIGHDDFWSKVGKDAVVIEADAIKNRDVMLKHLSSSDFTKNDPTLSSYVHEYSTKAAEAMLVAAVNKQRDIVFDGTMTWAPFVEQTIAMVRDHQHNYRRGPGYFTDENGNTVERYWDRDECAEVEEAKRPYRIEFVGVTCDAGLAVARGVWRKLRTGRSVPISSQLRSHRLFSDNWERLAHLADSATLYHTGSALTTFNKGNVNLNPKVIAHRSSATRGEMLVNSRAYRQFCHKARINDSARCRGELFLDTHHHHDKVPVSHEEQMSTLRQVFQAADRRERRERQQRRKAPGNAEEERPKHSPGLVANPYATAAAALQ
ncbi:g11522 [Coccomyxa elongata]